MATRNIVPRATGEGSLGTETKKWGNIYADNLHSSNPLPIANGGTGATTVAGARNALGLGNTTGALPIANGGTGATTAEQARANLGIKDIATYDVLPIANGGTGATTVAGARNALGLGNTTGALPIANGGTGATTAEQARANLGIKDIATYDVLPIANGGTGATTVAGARNALGLGNTTGALPIANGGTGASTAKQARANLEVEPIGTIFAFAGNTIPSGYLACNGAAISRTTYADLFAVIGITYGSGDGSTTFNLPNFENNSFMEFSGTVGKAKRAGLPNIKGSMRGLFGTGDISETFYTGAFESGTAGTQRMGTAGAVIDCQVYFNAAKISNVYSNDINTVQPKSVTVRAIIKY